ncbi:hypothetical protein ACJX0J_029141 [Zea mays]
MRYFITLINIMKQTLRAIYFYRFTLLSGTESTYEVAILKTEMYRFISRIYIAVYNKQPEPLLCTNRFTEIEASIDLHFVPAMSGYMTKGRTLGCRIPVCSSAVQAVFIGASIGYAKYDNQCRPYQIYVALDDDTHLIEIYKTNSHFAVARSKSGPEM